MGRTSDARARLLAAALDLIWAKSYGAVGVDDICERAGVKKGSFYHFFPSKSDLTAAACEYHWQRHRPELDAIFSPQVAPLARISAWCDYLYRGQKALFDRFGHVCGCPFANVGCELSTQDEKLRAKAGEMLERALRYLRTAIADAQREGYVEVEDVEAATQSIHSCALGLLLQAKVRNDPQVLGKLEPAVLRLLRAHRLSLPVASSRSAIS